MPEQFRLLVIVACLTRFELAFRSTIFMLFAVSVGATVTQTAAIGFLSIEVFSPGLASGVGSYGLIAGKSGFGVRGVSQLGARGTFPERGFRARNQTCGRGLAQLSYRATVDVPVSTARTVSV